MKRMTEQKSVAGSSRNESTRPASCTAREPQLVPPSPSWEDPTTGHSLCPQMAHAKPVPVTTNIKAEDLDEEILR